MSGTISVSKFKFRYELKFSDAYDDEDDTILNGTTGATINSTENPSLVYDLENRLAFSRDFSKEDIINKYEAIDRKPLSDEMIEFLELPDKKKTKRGIRIISTKPKKVVEKTTIKIPSPERKHSSKETLSKSKDASKNESKETPSGDASVEEQKNTENYFSMKLVDTPSTKISAKELAEERRRKEEYIKTASLFFKTRDQLNDEREQLKEIKRVLQIE
jgi:hypothetical protein